MNIISNLKKYLRNFRQLPHQALITIFIVISVNIVGSSNSYAVGYALHNDSILELEIAKDAPTRIIIENEKISDIFIHPEEAAEAVIHTSGCLFILPQTSKNRIYITIIGESGTTQDIALHFVKKKPSPIRLLKLAWVKEDQIGESVTIQDITLHSAKKKSRPIRLLKLPWVKENQTINKKEKLNGKR